MSPVASDAPNRSFRSAPSPAIPGVFSVNTRFPLAERPFTEP